MPIALRTREATNDLPGLRVRQDEVDAEEIRFRREERDVPSIGTLGRSEVVLVALLEWNDDASGAVRMRASRELASIECLVGGRPILRERVTRETQRANQCL